MQTLPFNEPELLRALKTRNNRAFDQVYNLFFRQLCYYCEGLTGSRTVGEDITVNSFVKLIENSPEFENLTKLKAWLFTISRNACLDHLKAEKRHRLSHEEIRYHAPLEEDEIEQRLILSEALQTIYEEIENLPASCREVIKLAFIEGFSAPEIAEATGYAYQSVLNQKAKGLKLLKNALIKNNLLSPAIFLACLVLLEENHVSHSLV